ncbi:FAD-dependent monooxygenase [Xinfangfangia sp. CPCC 101601]|uniref:FAD-dependent monooxygenase n=1 Tax=Pseudogemmobacter lacusdianii TaxID=3069608 RepID=A0ABU0VV80_9RHOB|nr:FAD-dependent monooxygenase [Xinfangfangia sp. CPCC 101601]MDQ2065644.1 FAD-dependent monooxygenase [Xinfangfangia sp. CPCC 101601]
MALNGRSVTILGAGVAGLSVARAMALRGAKVTVLEQASEISEIGAGLQISPNGAAVLKALGLGEALEAVSTRAAGVELRNGADGRLVTRLDVARLRPQQGYHFLHRADLIALLLDGARAAGVELRLLQKVERIDLSGQKPKLVMTTGAEEEIDLLIGADGLHSPARAALNGPMAPFFTRQVAWRALVPCDPSDPAMAEVHMAPGRHLVSYPLRGGTMRNIVAVEERDRWVDEGWSLRDDPMELRLAFEKFSPRVRGWLDQVEDVWLWGIFRHPVAKSWFKVLPEGALAILGDAAHPMLPFLAQGASVALEDAWVLAEALDRQSNDTAAMRAYQATRGPRAARVVDAANANAKNYHLAGAKRAAAHMVIRLGGKIAPAAALKRFDWLYNHDVTKPH